MNPFIDGSTRTALVAADVCLRLNGYRLVPSDEVEPFFWAVARGEHDTNQIADWVRTHMEAWRAAQDDTSQCSSDADCDDFLSCTNDRCVDNCHCVNDVIPDCID